jgi:TRAP-type C4-dicarboxylate transport system permease small subunit
VEPLRKVAGRLDALVFQLERVLLVISLAMMTVLVTADVLQRTFSRPVGKMASLLFALWADPSAEQRALVVDWLAPGAFGALSLVLCVLAAHARRAMAAKDGPPPGFVGSAVRGAILWAGLALAIRALLWAFPSSVPGAQKFALGFMLWSGMVGASLATRARRHIMLDAVTKKLTGQTQRVFFLLSGLTAAAFCGLLGVLGTIELVGQFHDWSQGEGIGEYDALPIPTWIATLAIPFAFWMMSARFLGQAVHDVVWGPPTGGTDAHGVDLEALAKEGPPA